MDVLVFDVAVSWQTYQQEQAQAKNDGKPAPAKLSVEKMQAMIDKVKKR